MEEITICCFYRKCDRCPAMTGEPPEEVVEQTLQNRRQWIHPFDTFNPHGWSQVTIYLQGEGTVQQYRHITLCPECTVKTVGVVP